MMRRNARLALAALACLAAHAATTTNTTLTVAATTDPLLSTSVNVKGTANLTGIGNGTFAATVDVAKVLGSTSTSAAIPFTITLSGGTLTGSLTVPVAMLIGTDTSGTGSATITGGTGTYAGATGTFASLAGTSSGSAVTGFSLGFTGAGSITTGGGGGTTTAPVITALQNNYSYILPGLPNYGIAPGTLFIIKGTNLNNQPISALQSSAAPGIPKTLNGTSVSVTVNGTTVTPGFYYSSPSQLGMVLPSNTPVGDGTITVTNAGTPSATFPIHVVQSAFGIDTYYGSGSGAGVATDANYTVFTAANSASPGQVIILWGSGVGADTSNDDITYPLKQNNLTNIPFTVYIGGISATVAYRGRSQFPGVDQVVVTIPQNVTPGCNVSVVAVSGSIVSNSVTLPIAAGGGACSDTNFGVTANQALNLSGKSSVNFGFASVVQSTTAGPTPTSVATTSNDAAAIFESVSGSQFAATGASGASIGSCIVTPPTVGTTSVPTFQGLDAGALTMNGPGGLVNLTGIPGFLGFYGAQLAAGAIPAGGGTFTFNGAGGKDVGSFTANLNFPTALVWTNMNSITSIDRTQGLPINWTGGGAGSYVIISGASTATINGQITSVGFTCSAPVSALTFTVPSAVLLALPAGSGSLTVENSTNPQTFTAKGLDLGYTFAAIEFTTSPSYK